MSLSIFRLIAPQLLVKSREGEFVKAVPVRITTAHRVTVLANGDPEMKQLILGYDYDITVDISNKEERQVYPSEVSLANTWTRDGVV